MSFNISTTATFERELKRLVKKYPSLKKDFAQLLTTLESNPQSGVAIGFNCFKIRLAISSKNKGKSGGARVITHVKIINEVIYLLSIYDKSEADSISDKEVLKRVDGL
jgi:mRNA-degrading endonuclease RelE of RelBE toxin-antitoxin system